MNSLEWSGGMERWSGLLDWSTGVAGRVSRNLKRCAIINFSYAFLRNPRCKQPAKLHVYITRRMQDISGASLSSQGMFSLFVEPTLKHGAIFLFHH